MKGEFKTEKNSWPSDKTFPWRYFWENQFSMQFSSQNQQYKVNFDDLSFPEWIKKTMERVRVFGYNYSLLTSWTTYKNFSERRRDQYPARQQVKFLRKPQKNNTRGKVYLQPQVIFTCGRRKQFCLRRFYRVVWRTHGNENIDFNCRSQIFVDRILNCHFSG